MEANGQLSPAQAEAIVDALIDQFGTGAYPKVSVTEVDAETWRISWRTMQTDHPPMSSEEWLEWLTRRVGTMTPERLETSEG